MIEKKTIIEACELAKDQLMETRVTGPSEQFIEMMQDRMDEETGGVSTDEGYLYNVSAEQLYKLECIMKDAARQWSKEAEINVTVTIVTDIKKYDLQTGKELHE